jgi:phosphatidylglycerophosphatase A
MAMKTDRKVSLPQGNSAAAAASPQPALGVTARAPASMWADLTATFFRIGRLHPGPGTWGSAATVVLWFLLTRFIPGPWQTPSAIVLAAFVVAVGIPAATRVSRASGLKDPQFVVIDEVAGQLITFIAVPVTWKSLLLGFILFRGFDILKPPPLRRLEQLREGIGIVVDDVGAGLYAWAIMQLMLYFHVLPR